MGHIWIFDWENYIRNGGYKKIYDKFTNTKIY